LHYFDFQKKVSQMNNRNLTVSAMLVPGRILINRKQLLKKIPLCERTILDMEKRGDFPRRFSIGPRIVAWDLNEVDSWIAAQHVAATQQDAPGSRECK
jgi:prophage regulatory protein